MIATLSIIFYIISTTEKIKTKNILQKEQAISKINNNGDHQIYNFSAWLSLSENTEEESQNEQEEIYNIIQSFETQQIYQVNEKFSVSNNKSIDLVISTNIHLQIKDVLISKPVVNFLGHTQFLVTLTESFYHFSL